jgi:hypothetical protein
MVSPPPQSSPIEGEESVVCALAHEEGLKPLLRTPPARGSILSSREATYRRMRFALVPGAACFDTASGLLSMLSWDCLGLAKAT